MRRAKRRISGMALLILALLQRIFLMSSLMLLLVWLIFFMVLIKLLPILGTISGKTVKLMVLALICQIGRAVQQECRDRKSGSAGMPRPISYAVFCLKKKIAANVALVIELVFAPAMSALYPRIVGHIARNEYVDLLAVFHRMALIVAALTAPIAALLVIFWENLVRVWSGDALLASNVGPLLSILAFFF